MLSNARDLKDRLASRTAGVGEYDKMRRRKREKRRILSEGDSGQVVSSPTVKGDTTPL